MELSICKIATIAARLIRGGVDQNPPTVDLYWGADYGRIVQSIVVIRIRCIAVWICRIGIAVIVRRMGVVISVVVVFRLSVVIFRFRGGVFFSGSITPRV